MLRASPPLTVGQAGHYYRSEFSRGDYYAERESEGVVASRWHGRGADRLGLSGRVKAEEFERLLEGLDPSGRNVLVAHREGKDERRAGWDVTISPHKSVSLQALVAADGQILDAHDRAVAKALDELERHVQSWRHGGREVVTTGETVAALFRHETSRALDPQLHTHCVLMNITRRQDGEWRAVDARGVFRAQRLGNEIYQAELRKELLSLGYEVQSYRDGRSGRQRVTGIAGFREEHLKLFSKRSREIERELKARGLVSGRHAERVALATRKTKPKGIDREALLWSWRTAAREAGLVFPKPEKNRFVSPGRLDLARELELSTRVAVNGARDHLSERRAVFSLSDLERETLSRGREHGVTIDEVRKEIASRDDLVVADGKDAVLARVTTRRAIEDERALLEAVERGRGRGERVPSRSEGRGLGEDQRRVARHVLASPDRILGVEGKAGTGKSTMLAYVREEAQQAGWRVRGFAPTTTAAGVLREGGIDATTVAALLKGSPSLKGRTRELWIVDEAGLLSTGQARELFERAERAEAKLVLVGDRAQHRAVEAGSPFEVLIERGKLATERLDTVRRQRDERLREVVLAASEKGGAERAVQLLERAERIVEIPDPKSRHERITRDFVEDGGRGVVIAPSNLERQDLNRRIREALIERGQIERKSVKAKVVLKQDLTAEEKRRASSFSDGDVLRFVRRSRDIEPGDRARVVAVDEKRNRLHLLMERTRLTKTINPRDRRGFEVERVQEKRFAAGDRIQFRERDRSLDVANGTIGRIERLDHGRGVATVDVGGRRFRLDLEEPRAIDHAYAVTSHRSQGLSRERVYLAIDTGHSEELVNRRQFYVGVSRAIEDARVYTDDRLALVRAVSREQGRETALELLRKDDERHEHGDDRAPGRDRRGEGADRGREPSRRGTEGERGAARAASGPERGRLTGAERVPGEGAAAGARGDRHAGDAPRRGRREAQPIPERAGARDDLAARGDRQGARAHEEEARPLAGGDRDRAAADRGLPGGRAGAVPRESGGLEAGPEGARAVERREAQARPKARALSREEIGGRAELQRLYIEEYGSMMRAIPDRGLAREAARLNVSALAAGQPRIVERGETLATIEALRHAVERGRDDLDAIRRAITAVVARTPTHIPPVRGRDVGRER